MSLLQGRSQGRQKTISKSFSLAGIGLHCGKECSLFISPAPADAGIRFIKEGREIPALISQVKDTKRGTSLNGIAVVEHLLAAIYGLGIDNLQIDIKGSELPALDGSALPYVEALRSAGAVEQKKQKNILALGQPVEIIEGEASLSAFPATGFSIDYMVNFPGVPEQRFVFDAQSQDFGQTIAPARTFGYIEEYELLKKEGLAGGASLENALVLGKDGYINQPRFPDELVRHKILDVMGDLALLGRPLLAKIRAVKSGHKLNIELARRLALI